jgi:hypothetical protein
MKKITFIILASLISLTASAKNLAELQSDFSSKTDPWTKQSKAAWVESNRADCEAALKEYYSSDLWKYFNTAEKPSSNPTGIDFSTIGYLVAVMLDNIDYELTFEQKVLSGSGKVYAELSKSDPNWRDKLVMAGYKVGGKDIRLALAMLIFNKDQEEAYIKYRFDDLLKRPSVMVWLINTNRISDILYSMNDLKEAYQLSVKVETAVLKASSSANKDKALKTIQSLQDTLYIRLTRSLKIQ